MKLLEIVRADHTANDVIATCMELARTINKIAVLVGVCPGFVGNRILFARQAQAQRLVAQGAMPCALLPIVLARHYGGHVATAVQVIIATSIVSLFTIPAVIGIALKILNID